MARTPSPRFWQPGTGRYDAARAKDLQRQRSEAKAALASARRAKAPDAIRKAKQRSARIEHELTKLADRQAERARLARLEPGSRPDEGKRGAFNRMGIAEQNLFLKDSTPELRDPVLQLRIKYPDKAPTRDVPDPFGSFGEMRKPTWKLYYQTIIKKKGRAKKLQEAAE